MIKLSLQAAGLSYHKFVTVIVITNLSREQKPSRANSVAAYCCVFTVGSIVKAEEVIPSRRMVLK